jgi:hypothetical protein
VHFRAHPSRGKSSARQFHQAIVPSDSLLKQGQSFHRFDYVRLR